MFVVEHYVILCNIIAYLVHKINLKSGQLFSIMQKNDQISHF